MTDEAMEQAKALVEVGLEALPHGLDRRPESLNYRLLFAIAVMIVAHHEACADATERDEADRYDC